MEFRLEASNGADMPAVLQKSIGKTRQQIGIIDVLEEGDTTIARIKAPTIYALQLLIEELKKERGYGHIASVDVGKIEED